MSFIVPRRLLPAAAAMLAIGLVAGLSACNSSPAPTPPAAGESSPAPAQSAAAGQSTAAPQTTTAPAAPQDNPHVNLIVGGPEKVIYLPAKLAEGLGLFVAEGLNVDIIGEQSGATAENSLLTGNADGVIGFYDHTIDIAAAGKCLTSVVQLANIPGEAEMVATDKADVIKSAADFEGKSLGITSLGSSTDFLTQALAGQAGVKNYTPTKVGAGQTFIAAMEQGAIDAGMTTDPTIATLLESGKGQVLIEMRTEEGTRAALGGLYPAASLYMACDYVENNKATVQKLANALVGALRFINTHTAAEIAAKMPAEYANAGQALYEKSINDTKTMFTPDGVIDPEGAKNVLRILDLYSANVKGKGASIDLSQTYTTQFVMNVP
jgi:NitT/TauT family transport system substrate-binding protein